MEMVKEILDIQSEREENEKRGAAIIRGMGGHVIGGADVKIMMGGIEIGTATSIEANIERTSGFGDVYTIGYDEGTDEDRRAVARMRDYEGSLTIDSMIIDEDFIGHVQEAFGRELERSIFRGAPSNWFEEVGKPYQGRAERRKKKKGLQHDNEERQKLGKMLGGRKHWK